MNKFAFVDCKTVDEALGQLDNGATVKAGGIDLLDLDIGGRGSPQPHQQDHGDEDVTHDAIKP